MKNKGTHSQKQGKQHKSEHRHLEEPFEFKTNILSQMNDAVITIDNEHRITYWNNGAERLYNFKTDEALGMPLEEVYRYRWLKPDDEQAAYESLAATGFWHGENIHIKKSGEEIYVESSISVLKDKSGAAAGLIAVVRDITERRRLLEQLQNKQQHTETLAMALKKERDTLQAIMENTGAQLAYLDSRFNFIRVNSAYAQGSGHTRDELIGRSHFELFPDPENRAIFEKVRDTGEAVEFKARPFVFTDQPWRGITYWDWTLTPIKNASGNVERLVLSLVDVTESKRMEEALRKAYDELELRVEERTAQLQEANEVWQDTFDAISDGVWILDPEGRIIQSNGVYERLLGIKTNDAIGQHCYKIAHCASNFIEKCPFKRMKRIGMREHIELEDRERGLWFQITVDPIRDNSGAIISAVHIVSDITERKLALEQIREQATLLDKAQDAIAVRDLEHRLIYWNKSAERLYGWTAEEAIGKNANELLYNEETPQLIFAKKKVIEEGEWTGELRQVAKDGKELIVEGRWTLVHDNKGEPKSILIINTDITEKKMLEAQFLRAQRMEGIGTLASGIAHDLNNVLTPVMMSVQILKEKFKDEESQSLLSILETNSQRGADLIKQVLSFARGVEGERIDLKAIHLISEIKKIAKETFPRSIEIRTNVQKDLWTITGDATQLHQVIMNLCVNARDAMPDGGILSICAENLLIDENYARMNIEARVGPYIVITVSDTGTGIPPEMLGRIFEPFFTTKKHGEGTGLGLSTVLAIVKSHGGFINVYSEVEKGTRFKVYLPAIKTIETQRAEELQQQLPVGHGESILVVDDEASIRRITQATLETYGYKVITANDGTEAIAMYLQNREEIRVVLMDMMMPIMDGQTCIRTLCKINPELKIIAVSGLIEYNQFVKVEDMIHAFLSKPYTSENLLKTIHEALSVK